MRLIDADALTGYIKACNIGCGCSEDHQERILEAIDDFPTIQPEPCEDAVSRQEAIDALIQNANKEGKKSNEFAVSGCNDLSAKYGHGEYCFYVAVEELRKLPSVTPKPRTEKCVWCGSPFRIEYYWIDKQGCTASFQDEECHMVATGIAKYCPNCGRKMQEETE